MSSRDELFLHRAALPFAFDEEVAAVFDDMLTRSIPFYTEAQRLTLSLLSFHLRNSPSRVVVDLGCSTASLLIALHTLLGRELSLTLIGVDSSEPMLQRAHHKAHAFGAPIEFLRTELEGFSPPPADVILAHYTLQFLPLSQRRALSRRVADALQGGGLFLVAEKIRSQEEGFEEWMGQEYIAFKKAQGYSELEIMRKKEALEEVLVPLSLEENVALLKEAGFVRVQPLLQWVNFVLLAAKT